LQAFAYSDFSNGDFTDTRRPTQQRQDRRDGEGADQQKASQRAWPSRQAGAEQRQEEPVGKFVVQTVLGETCQTIFDDRFLFHLVHRTHVLPEATNCGKIILLSNYTV